MSTRSHDSVTRSGTHFQGGSDTYSLIKKLFVSQRVERFTNGILLNEPGGFHIHPLQTGAYQFRYQCDALWEVSELESMAPLHRLSEAGVKLVFTGQSHKAVKYDQLHQLDARKRSGRSWKPCIVWCFFDP
jgi:hypothetical protein